MVFVKNASYNEFKQYRKVHSTTVRVTLCTTAIDIDFYYITFNGGKCIKLYINGITVDVSCRVTFAVLTSDKSDIQQAQVIS